MSRGATSDVIAAAAARLVRPAWFGDFDFSGGHVRVWTGYGDKVLGGNTYKGLGELGAVTFPDETRDIRAASLAFVLSGVPSALVSKALTENYRNRAVVLYLAFLNTDQSIISDPLQWRGRMDQCSINDDGTAASIRVTAESRLADLNRPREIRITDEAQQGRFPGDLGFQYVALLQNTQVVWGVGDATTPGYRGSNSTGVQP